MTLQTATRLTGDIGWARPFSSVRDVIRIIQGGAASTTGSPLDRPWFDQGTAAWPVAAQEPKPVTESSLPALEAWDTRTTFFGTTAFQSAPVQAKDEAMARMVAAAATGDERAFLAAKDAVEWEVRPAADFIRAIELALAAGAHLTARDLAAQGVTRHPENTRLQRLARVLAPPRVLHNDAPPQSGLRANRDWLVAHGNQYRGRWVALRQGQLLGVADSLTALKKLVGDTTNVLMTKAF